jgi:hypothetical protein
MSKEKESTSGGPEGARRATGGPPEERPDGRGRWFRARLLSRLGAVAVKRRKSEIA